MTRVKHVQLYPVQVNGADTCATSASSRPGPGHGQPIDAGVFEGKPVTFANFPDSNPTIYFQWPKTETEIP